MNAAAVKVLLVRHGATTASAEEKFAGSSDVDLSEEGLKQARRLAARLARTRIGAADCSPMNRAVIAIAWSRTWPVSTSSNSHRPKARSSRSSTTPRTTRTQSEGGGMTEMSVNDALRLGIARHEAGQLTEAEAAYRAVLARTP